jgi:hypothetical protein
LFAAVDLTAFLRANAFVSLDRTVVDLLGVHDLLHNYLIATQRSKFCAGLIVIVQENHGYAVCSIGFFVFLLLVVTLQSPTLCAYGVFYDLDVLVTICKM